MGKSFLFRPKTDPCVLHSRILVPKAYGVVIPNASSMLQSAKAPFAFRLWRTVLVLKGLGEFCFGVLVLFLGVLGGFLGVWG